MPTENAPSKLEPLVVRSQQLALPSPSIFSGYKTGLVPLLPGPSGLYSGSRIRLVSFFEQRRGGDGSANGEGFVW